MECLLLKIFVLLFFREMLSLYEELVEPQMAHIFKYNINIINNIQSNQYKLILFQIGRLYLLHIIHIKMYVHKSRTKTRDKNLDFYVFTLLSHTWQGRQRLQEP